MIPSLQEVTAAPISGLDGFQWLRPLDRRLESALSELLTSSVDMVGAASELPPVVTQRQPKTVLRESRGGADFDERLFNALVRLKVAVAEFATHLSRDQRALVFRQLEAVINPDDWHEDDELPRPQAFRDLLRWAIHSTFYDWTSIGVSDEGHILVAWVKVNTRLTANFSGDGQVKWTSRVLQTNGEPALAAGKCSLSYFTKQATFVLTE
jgi:hypothetical protein